MDTFTESHQVKVTRCMLSTSSALRFHSAQIAPSGKTTPTADTREEPPKWSGSWDITEMPHQKGKGFLPGSTAEAWPKIVSSQDTPSCTDVSISWCSLPVIALTFMHKIKTRLANIPNGPVKLITLEELETNQQQEPAPAPEPLQKSRIQEMEKPLSFL